jgi:hypothetical protein
MENVMKGAINDRQVKGGVDAQLKRLNIVLPDRTVARIENIKRTTMASSATDVIKTALLTYEALVEFASEGKKFFIKGDGEHNFIPVNFMFDVQLKDGPEMQAAK